MKIDSINVYTNNFYFYYSCTMVFIFNLSHLFIKLMNKWLKDLFINSDTFWGISHLNNNQKMFEFSFILTGTPPTRWAFTQKAVNSVAEQKKHAHTLQAIKVRDFLFEEKNTFVIWRYLFNSINPKMSNVKQSTCTQTSIELESFPESVSVSMNLNWFSRN